MIREDRIAEIAKVIEERHLDIMLANTLPDLGYKLVKFPPVQIDDRLESLRVNFGLMSKLDAQRIIDRVKELHRPAIESVVSAEEQNSTRYSDDQVGGAVSTHMSVLKMSGQLDMGKPDRGIRFAN